MKIFYKLSDYNNPNYIVKYNDNTFGSKVYWDFQVSLTSDCSVILNFDTYSKRCVSCEGYILACLKRNKKIKYENIVIEKFSNGELLIELEDFEKERLMKEYLLGDKIKYDINKSLICIGDINIDRVIMFGIGQYASFRDDKLIGIIIDFSSFSSENI